MIYNIYLLGHGVCLDNLLYTGTNQIKFYCTTGSFLCANNIPKIANNEEGFTEEYPNAENKEHFLIYEIDVLKNDLLPNDLKKIKLCEYIYPIEEFCFYVYKKDNNVYIIPRTPKTGFTLSWIVEKFNAKLSSLLKISECEFVYHWLACRSILKERSETEIIEANKDNSLFTIEKIVGLP